MYALIIILSLLFGCGSQSGGEKSVNAAGAPIAMPDSEDPRLSIAVADDTALPTCNASSEGRLVYVKSSGVMKFCGAGVWEVAVDGSRTVEMYAIKGGVNLCDPAVSSRVCQFTGGSVVKKANNEIDWMITYYTGWTTDTGTRREHIPYRLLIRPGQKTNWLPFSTNTDPAGRIFAVVDTTTLVVRIMNDTNSSNAFDEGDIEITKLENLPIE